MTDRELMQQALEALDWAADCIEPRKPHNCDCPICVASDALLQRLAQPGDWVGLTEAERIDIIDEEITAQSTEHFALAQAIEAKLREKNT